MLETGQAIRLEKGSYRLDTPLGLGAQGSVWRVVGLRDNRKLALKIPHLDDNPERRRALIERIEGEIAFLQALPDPETHFIVPCLDAGYWRDGDERFPAFVMPYYPDRLAAYDRAPDGATLLRWAAQLAEALRWLHAQGGGGRIPIHRDLKPENVLLTAAGEPRLIDFGIVKTMGGTATLGHRDAKYFAPEQRLPIDPGASEEDDRVAPTAKSDIYCLGLTLYRLAIGHSAMPAAQIRLSEVRTRAEHLRKLASDGRGLLGEVGGLTGKERQGLKQALIDLFSGRKGGTLVVQASGGLPDHRLIATLLADRIERLLAADPRERPDAMEARAGFGSLRQALSPRLEQLTLTASSSEVAAGEHFTLCVEARGVGLPADSHWLTLAQDGQPLHAAPLDDPMDGELLSGDVSWRFRWRPGQDQEGERRLTAVCRVGSEERRAELTYRVRAAAQQPSIAADQAHGTRQIRRERVDPGAGDAWNWRSLAYTGILALALGIGYWGFTQVDWWSDFVDEGPGLVEQPSLPTPAIGPAMPEVDSQDDSVQTDLYADLDQWVQVGDVTAIRGVLAKLDTRAERNQGQAYQWLGYLYAKGLGVERDLAKARRYLQQALDLGEDAARTSIDDLDRLCDLLLRSRDPGERALGYGLAEAAAEAGDINAMVWMGYRHERGDGVPPDLDKAKGWYDKAGRMGDGVAAQRLVELAR